MYNQQTAPISLINDDLLSLDGNKLMLISGNYGVANSTYGYEMETYASIRAVSLGGNDIWFQVKTKDGNSIEFGNGNNSRVTGQNGRTLFWKINKIIDNEGNYIEFKYVNVDFENLIEDINFTGNQNAGLLPYNNIHFSYLNRFDKNTNYIYGEKSK